MRLDRFEPLTLPFSRRRDIVCPAFVPINIAILNRDLRFSLYPIDRPDTQLERPTKANGFSLHAGVICEGHQNGKLERLSRYMVRSTAAVPRLPLNSTGKILYTLKTPYQDGTTQAAFDPADFIT
jgi:hypothetical protein